MRSWRKREEHTTTHYLTSEQEKPALCVVCMSEFQNPVACKVCHHAYCWSCVRDLLASHCSRCGNGTFVKCDNPEETAINGSKSMTCQHCRWHGPSHGFMTHLCTGPSEYVRDPSLPQHPNITASSPLRVRPIESSMQGSLKAIQLKECIDAVRSNHLNAQAWFHLGNCLNRAEDVVVLSSCVTKVGCYTTSLHLDPHNEDCWRALGKALQPGEHCQVTGCPYSRRDCAVRALMLDDSSPDDWMLLGTTIRPGEVVILPATSRYHLPLHVSAVDCFKKALVFDNRHAAAYAHLASRLVENQCVIVNGEQIDRITAARLAIALDGSQFVAWKALGDAIDVGETIRLMDGSEVGREDCLAMFNTFYDASLAPLSPLRHA